MQIHITRVPGYVEFCWDVSKRSRERALEHDRKAEAETDPSRRQMFQRWAKQDRKIAAGFDADATDLLQQFTAAGGQCHRVQ